MIAVNTVQAGDSFVRQIMQALMQIRDSCEKGGRACRIRYQQWLGGEDLGGFFEYQIEGRKTSGLLKASSGGQTVQYVDPMQSEWMINFDEGTAGVEDVHNMVKALTDYSELSPYMSRNDAMNTGFGTNTRLVSPAMAGVEGVLQPKTEILSEEQVTGVFSEFAEEGLNDDSMEIMRQAQGDDEAEAQGPVVKQRGRRRD